MLSHFDVRSQFSTELGRALARVYDKNNFRQMVLAARTSADGPFPGGNRIDDSGLAKGAVTAGKYDGEAWIQAIRDANKKLHEKDVPEDVPRYMAVNWEVFDAIKYATDSNGNYLVLNRDIAGIPASGGIGNREDTLTVDGVTIYKTRNMPSTDESSDNSVYSKYRANYAAVEGVLWTPMTVANVKMKDISLETERDTRRLEDFMVSSMLAGHGTLRPETGVEFADGSVAE